MSEASDVAARPELMRTLMQSIVTFMNRIGMSMEDIEAEFHNCTRGALSSRTRTRKSPRNKLAYGCDTVAGAVLRAWHRNPQFLDTAARPLPLPMSGAKPSLTGLVHSQNRRADAKGVITSMLNAGLLKKHGKAAYLPTRESATVQLLDPLSVDHIAKAVIRLVETASRNVENSRGKVSLIERYAHVPDLKASDARAFAAFSRQQGQACLDTIEDWLESRQLKPLSQRSYASGNGVTAGVHIFAYLGEPILRKKRVARNPGKRRPTPAREARA